jgi:ABC-2 type transport system ATP-binding protein
MILKAENLTKSFKNGKKEHIVLNSIDFEVKEREIFSILGSNGAGKTTLIKLMTKLLNPNNGNIYYNGKNIAKIGEKYYKEIGCVLEGNRNTYWFLSALENIFYFGRLYGLKDGYIKKKGYELLEFFELIDDKDKKVGQFSLGMQQKLSIIISLIHQPKILFLDEPTLGLDVVSKLDIIDKLKQLSKNEGVTIILTSHQMDVIEKTADRVLLLKDSKIHFLDTIDKLKSMYSKNKYLLKIEGDFTKKQIDKYFDGLTLGNHTRNESYTEIEFYTDYCTMQQDFLKSMINDGIKITEFVKIETDLEEIIYMFLKNQGDGQNI